MAKIERFEDIKAWDMARGLVATVYRLSGTGNFSQDFGLKDQARRAAISVMSNIAEGFERGSRAEFTRFLKIAKASCGEVRSQLYVALDLNYVNRQEFVAAKTKAEDVSKALGAFIRYLTREHAK